jgi:hypothetical protein
MTALIYEYIHKCGEDGNDFRIQPSSIKQAIPGVREPLISVAKAVIARM